MLSIFNVYLKDERREQEKLHLRVTNNVVTLNRFK